MRMCISVNIKFLFDCLFIVFSSYIAPLRMAFNYLNSFRALSVEMCIRIYLLMAISRQVTFQELSSLQILVYSYIFYI